MIAPRSFLRPLAFLLAPLVMFGCSKHEAMAPIGGDNVVEVTLTNYAFTAPTVTISRGESIRWRNTTGTFHTVTPDGHQMFAERQTNAQGQAFETRFDAPGRYKYYCTPHQALGMTGEIVVN